MTVLFGLVGALWILGTLAKISSPARRKGGLLGTHDPDEEARDRMFVWQSHERDDDDDFWNPG
jgi:hypothetical protein